MQIIEPKYVNAVVDSQKTPGVVVTSLSESISFAKEHGDKHQGRSWRGLGEGDYDQAVEDIRSRVTKKLGRNIDLGETAFVGAQAAYMSLSNIGSFVDIPTYLSGDPDCMFEIVGAGGELVSNTVIVINASVSWTVCAEDVENYGIKVASVVEELFTQGSDVTVYSGYTGDGWGGLDVFSLNRLSDSTSSFSLTDISTMGCGAYALRELLFTRSMEMGVHNVVDGLGRPTSMHPEDEFGKELRRIIHLLENCDKLVIMPRYEADVDRDWIVDNMVVLTGSEITEGL